MQLVVRGVAGSAVRVRGGAFAVSRAAVCLWWPRAYQERIMKKLRVNTRAELMRFAIREGLAQA